MGILCVGGPRRPSALRLQIAQQTVKGLLVGVVVLPVGEVWNVIFAYLYCQIFAKIGIEAFPIFDCLPICQTDWKQLLTIPADRLVNTLTTVLPLDSMEKQALLEAVTPQDRINTLITALEIECHETHSAPQH